jgi:hypothetical protein
MRRAAESALTEAARRQVLRLTLHRLAQLASDQDGFR